MMFFLTLALAVLPLSAQPSVAYSATSFSCGIGYTTIRIDNVANGVLAFCKSAGNGIFATDMYEYVLATGLGTHIVGTGSLVDTAPADLPITYDGSTFISNPGGLPNRPADRHPVSQMAVDTNRNLLFMGGGISRDSEYSAAGSFTVTGGGTAATCGASCNFPVDGSWSGLHVYVVGTGSTCPSSGSFCTIASVSDNTHLTFTTGPGSVSGSYQMFFVDAGMPASAGLWNDMYYLKLNATPTTNVWTRLLPAHTPYTISGGSFYYQGTFVADTFDDCWYSFEGTHAWRYCPTLPVGGGTPSGTLSAAQTAAGATTPDDWTIESTTLSNQPYACVVFEPTTNLIYIFGGSYINQTQLMYVYNPGGSTRSAGSVSVTSHTAVQLCTSGCTNPGAEYDGTHIQTEYSACDLDTKRHTILYHRTSNDGVSGPADYEFCITCGTTGVWTQMTASPSGDGNTNGAQMQYDPTTNKVVTSGVGGSFLGTLTDPGGSVSGGQITSSGSVVIH